MTVQVEVIDLGFCPHCFDQIQPKHKHGYPSQKVDGVVFCRFCATHITPIELKTAKTKAKLIQTQQQQNPSSGDQ
jgi:hypothetical protein